MGCEILSWRLFITFIWPFPCIRLFGSGFLNCPTAMPQIPSSVYKSLLELPLGLNRAWANLIRNLSWRMLITFFASLIMINLGHWVHNYSEPQKILVFLFGFSRWTHQTWRFQKHGRVQKINLYLCTSSVLPLHQIKNSCKVNLFFTHQINNLD